MKTPAKVLICDDEHFILEGFEFFLSDYAVQVTRAISGNDAIGKITEKFDVIISDYKMPDGDGSDLLAYLRANEDLFPGRFIFFSGHLDLLKNRDSDVMIISKPNFHEVLQLLEKLLQKA